MYRKKIVLLMTSFLLAFSFLGGCGDKPEPEVTQEPEIEEQITQEVPEEPVSEEPEIVRAYPVIEEREVVNGKMQSYLTGEWVDSDIATRRPIAVMIPKTSLPCLNTGFPRLP